MHRSFIFIFIVFLLDTSARLTQQEVENYPLGYPRQAAFADSDESFMLYRRFGNVHARLLLHKQDELREMEEDLKDMDLQDDHCEESKKYLKSRDLDEERAAIPDQEPRSQLLARMEKKTMQYGRFFTSTDFYLVKNHSILDRR